MSKVRCISCGKYVDPEKEYAQEVRNTDGYPGFECEDCYYYGDEEFEPIDRDLFIEDEDE